MNLLGRTAPFLVKGLESDVALERLEGLNELLGELVEGLHELLLLIFFTVTPVTDFELVDQGLVDVVDDGVQGSDRVFRDFTKQNLLVILTSGADRFARRH